MLSDVEIGSLLGRGAYGYVYLGRWLSAQVAIKVAFDVHCYNTYPNNIFGFRQQIKF